MKQFKRAAMLLFAALITSAKMFASEADIAIPDLHAGEFHIFGQAI
jgi:K(+)-stimulated pyrophosphate-energized sodium pump